MDLQELIVRGRFVFSNAPERLGVFKLVNGRRTASDIGRTLKRHVNNIHRDLRLLNDAELIRPRINGDGMQIRDAGFLLYEITPLARTVPTNYFLGPAKLVNGKQPLAHQSKQPKRLSSKRLAAVPMPTEVELLDICKEGEDQVYEFKSAGTEVRKITREIAAMLNTKQGGIVLYGVDDDGTIQGSDVSRQKFDQPLQNSVKNSISPAVTVGLKSVSVMGSQILAILVPPWNRRDVYQFDERVLIRKGTNVFACKPEELRKLHKGEYVI
jgi:predicted HTH transcriptional regulator